MSAAKAIFIALSNVIVVVCPDLSDKDPHRQVCVGRMITSGSLGDLMVSVVVCTDPSDKDKHRLVGVGW